MIAACNTQDFVPFGREYARRHPGTFQLQVQKNVNVDHGLPLLKSFRDISLQESNKKEQWLFSKGSTAKDETFDEEIYFSGNTVIWSQGGVSGSRAVIKTFTVDTPVIQAIWANFVLPHKENAVEINPTLSPPGTKQSGVCVVESNTVNFFQEKGGDYSAALPFQVATVWNIQNGLLFERTVSPSEISGSKRNSPNQTTVFSMLHPLDEVAPVITKTSGHKLSYMTDNTQHIIFTSEEPSIVFTYDTMVGVHTAWRIRRARCDECNSVCGLMENSFYHPATPATPVTGMISMTGLNNLNQSSSSHSRLLCNLSAQSPSISPMRNFSGRISSPGIINKPIAIASPAVSNMPSISRSQSPALGTSMHRLHSPSPSANRSPGNYFRTPPVGTHNVSLINESFSDWVEPLKPEVCFEHLWTEPAPAIRDGSLGKSSKAFLTKDMCGQQYLCYVISYRQQLRCVKFEESNDLSQLIFGAVSVIPAKDAIPIESLNMQIVLDPNGGLWVYSGTVKINRLHIPTLPVGSSSMSMMRAVTPINSPQRGGIFTSSRPSSAMDAGFDEEMTQFSPVPTELEESGQLDESTMQNSFIQGLRDNVGNRFSIELVNQHLCRVTLPKLTSSPGIDLCLQALKHMLPKDLAISFLGKWYTSKNTPGGYSNQSDWTLFARCLMSSMGYDIARLALTKQNDMDNSLSPIVSVKRAKHSEIGAEDDWDYLLNTAHHKSVGESFCNSLGLEEEKAVPDTSSYSKPCSINTGAHLFVQIPSVFMGLHLVYEELKLSKSLAEDAEQLVIILYQIASDLKLSNYTDYYSRDFQHLFSAADDVSQITEEHLTKMQYPGVFSKFVQSVNIWLLNNLRGEECGSFPYIPGVCNNIRNVISLYSLILKKDLPTEQVVDRFLRKVAPAGHRAPTCDLSMSRSFSRSFSVSVPTSAFPERILLYMSEIGLKEQDLDQLPVGISLPLREAIFYCRCNPPTDWTEEAYALMGRQDLSKLLSMEKKGGEVHLPLFGQMRKNYLHGKSNEEQDDGMDYLDEELLKLRFSEDLRIKEVKRLLQSSRPARIALVQRPEVSDHDFIEEQEKHLYSICIRTMALPVGRGMFTLCTYHPLPTEALPIPKLCLTGRAPPRNATVDLTRIDTPPNMSAWPQFHNGVAAGLRMANSSQVDSAWIVYNRPKGNELSNEYAGFLMALGLNGHLSNLHTLNIHDALSKGHEMTTIGLLLGKAATRRGTMDLATTRVLSIHIPALLPPTSTELNVPHHVQVAAVLGVGLVYQGTGHRHTAEVLLSEIGRPPGPEMENCNDRESYSLAAGLALGLIMFGKGGGTMGTPDLSMADTLYHFMVGGHKRPLVGPNKDRYKSPSYQIKEGDGVNVDVTSPGATLALGMLYFGTNNVAVADWLMAADTQFMLDHVRPDFLLLRTLSRGLVMWDYVSPTVHWVTSNIPPIIARNAFQVGAAQESGDTPIDYETMSQAYCNILSGACMVLGLKFAGTANKQAFDTLMSNMDSVMKIMSCPAYVEQAGKFTVESCMMNILLTMAMVMSGTGNLEVLRMCRMLRSRIGQHNLGVTYGSHMAISMAIGLLFLGGGRYSLSCTPEAISVLLTAFYPKFPISSNDNRYHLQAFRHLYVLAAQPRVILPRDVDTGQSCYVPLEITFKATENYRSQSYKTSAPCVLPQLDLIEEVKILGPRYWPISFHVNKNWNHLQSVLQRNGILFVKQRAGHLSYVEDANGYRSMLAASLTSDHSSHCNVKSNVIKAFTSNRKILALTEYFLKNKEDTKADDYLQTLSCVVYECVTKEKPEMIASYMELYHIIAKLDSEIRSYGIYQLKLVKAYYNSSHCLKSCVDLPQEPLMKMEFLVSLKSRLEHALDEWLKDNMAVLVKYLQGEMTKNQELGQLSSFLQWYDIPTPSQIAKIAIEGAPTLPVLSAYLRHLSIATVMRILTAWKAAV